MLTFFGSPFGNSRNEDSAKCRAVAPIEDITFDRAAVLQRDRDVAAIIERLFQRLAQFSSVAAWPHTLP
jgi:hypothetical protein